MRITGRIAKLETWSHRAQRHQHEAETRALFQILVPHGDARRAVRRIADAQLCFGADSQQAAEATKAEFPLLESIARGCTKGGDT